MSDRRPDIELTLTPPPEALYGQRQRVLDDQAWNALIQGGAAQAETQTPAKGDRVNANVSAIPAVQMAPEPVPAEKLPAAPPDTPDTVLNLVEAARVSQTDPMMLEAIVKAAQAGFPSTAAGVAPSAAKPVPWLDWLGNVAALLGQAKATRGGVGEPKVPGARTTRAAREAATAEEKAAAVEVFGAEAARRYERLQVRANTADRATADAATAEIKAMEAGLTPEQQRRLFGADVPPAPAAPAGPRTQTPREMAAARTVAQEAVAGEVAAAPAITGTPYSRRNAVHVTTPEGATAIRARGFDLTATGGIGGDTYGPGIYLSDERVASFWREQLATREESGLLPTAAILGHVDLRNALVVEDMRRVGKASQDIMRPLDRRDIVKTTMPDKLARFDAMVAEGQSPNNALGQMAREAGYDGMVFQRRAGDEIIVFDPARVTFEGAPVSAPSSVPRVNVGRLGAEGRVKDLITRIDTEMQATGEMGARTVGKQPHAETIRKSMAPGMSAADLLAIPPDQALNASQQTRLRDLRDRAAKLVDDLAAAARKGDQAAADDLPSAATLFGDLHARDIAAGETVAQALEARKITSDMSRARTAELAALADRYRDAAAADGFDLAQRIGTLPNADARRTFILNTLGAVRRGGQFAQGLFYEYWVNALLSNPISHAANTLSSSLQVLWMPVERFLAASASVTETALFSNPRTVFFSEAGAAFKGIWTGLRRGLELAGKRVRGEPVFGNDKAIEFPQAWTSENFGLRTDSLAGAAIDYLGMTLRSPGAAMAVEDAFFKGVIFQMELEAQIAREIAKRGLRGEAAADLATAFRRTPPAEVQAAAEQMALVKTFNRDLGPLGQSFLDFVNTAPGARLIFPFIRTPANILKEVSYVTPGVNVLTMAQELLPSNGMLQSKLLNDLAAGGEARAFALAKFATSAVIGAAFVELAAAGRISGPGPKDKTLRRDWQAQGFQPYHIYPDGATPGAEGYAYARGTEPFGTSIAILATFAEIAGQIPEGDRLALAMAMTLAVSEHMADKPYLQGMSQLLAALHAPDKGGKAWIESFTRSLVPGAVRGVARSGIPGLMAGDKMRRDPIALTEMERLLNIIKQSVPGYTDDLPPVLHPITGEPVMFPAGWGPDIVSPVAMSKLKDDPVLREIVENKISLPAPGDYIRGSAEPLVAMQEETGRTGILLSPQEKHDLYVLLTKEVRDGQDRTLHQALTALVASDRYQRDSRGPGGGRELRIKQVYLEYRKKAEQELLRKHDLLREAVEQVRTQRLELRRPGEGPQAPSVPTLPIMPGRVDRPPLQRPSDIRQLIEGIGR